MLSHCLSGSWSVVFESYEVIRNPNAAHASSDLNVYSSKLRNLDRIDIRQMSREKEEILLTYVQKSGAETFYTVSLEELNKYRGADGDHVGCVLFVNSQFHKFCHLSMGPETGCRLLEDFVLLTRDEMEITSVVSSPRRGYSFSLMRKCVRQGQTAKPIVFAGCLRVLNWRESQSHCGDTLNELQVLTSAATGLTEDSTLFNVHVVFRDISWDVTFVYSSFCAVRDVVLKDLSFMMGEYTDKPDQYACNLSLPYVSLGSAIIWNDSAVEKRTTAIQKFLIALTSRSDLHDSSNAVSALSAFLQVPHHWSMLPSEQTVFDHMLSLSAPHRNSVVGASTHSLYRDSSSTEPLLFFLTVKNTRVRKHAVFPCVSLAKIMPHVEYEICLTRSDVRSKCASGLMETHSAKPKLSLAEVEGVPSGEGPVETQKAITATAVQRPDVRSSVFRRYKEVAGWLFEVQQLLHSTHKPQEVEDTLQLSSLEFIQPAKSRGLVDNITIPSSSKLDLNGAQVRQRMVSIERIINDVLDHYPEVLDSIPTLEFLGIGTFVDRVDAADSDRVRYSDFL